MCLCVIYLEQFGRIPSGSRGFRQQSARSSRARLLLASSQQVHKTVGFESRPNETLQLAALIQLKPAHDGFELRRSHSHTRLTSADPSDSVASQAV